MLIILLVLWLIFAGGFGYYGYKRYGPRGGIGVLIVSIGLAILFFVLVWLFGGGFHLHD